MIKASPRLGALLAGGAAVVAFGLTGQATAAPGGANQSCEDGQTHAYCPTNVGEPSMNGNGKGKAVGKPAAGTVGNADHKNPPGQFPDGSDANNGYECDGNNGIGKTNPAHTGCKPTTPPEEPEEPCDPNELPYGEQCPEGETNPDS